VLTDTLEDVEKLGRAIQKEVTQRLLSQAHDALNAGQTVDFGKVGVSRSGIMISKKTIPWKEIKKVDVSDGFVTISRVGKHLNWVAKVADIPNVYVFLTLVNQALGVVKPQKTAQAASTGMVLDAEKGQPIQNATESDIARLFDDDKARGGFVILTHSKQYYVQAAGEGNGPYTLECRAGDDEHHFRCTQSLSKQAVQSALLKYLRHDPAFTTDFVWEKVKL
jgi:tRNA-binding EMAP/Myf-like protein